MGKRLSREKRAELIEQYMALPRSQKRAWIKERGLTFSQMSNWRKAYIFGDLAEGRRALTPVVGHADTGFGAGGKRE